MIRSYYNRFINLLKKSTLVHNILNLFVIEGINHLLPFLALPFLYRVLGASDYGVVASAYSFFMMINLVVDFGFNLSATREVSINRDNRAALNKIVSDTISSRLLLFILALVISVLVIENTNFRENRLVFYLMIGIPLGNCFFPIWFFQGMEKMAYITTTTTLAKLLSFLPMFLIVRSPSDILWVSIFYSLGFIFSGIVAIIILRRKFGIEIRLFNNIRSVTKTIGSSSPYFLSRISASFYGTGNTILLGIFCSSLLVGYYDSAHKIILAYSAAMTPFQTALFPYMIKNRNVKVFVKVVSLLTGIGIIFSIVMFLFTPEVLILLFGEASDITVDILRIMLIYTLVKAPSSLMGYPLLAALGHTKYTNYTVVISGMLYVVATAIVCLLGKFTIYYAAVIYVMCECLVFVMRVIGVIHYKSLKQITTNERIEK